MTTTPTTHDLTTLPPGMLACALCGTVTPEPADPAEVVTADVAGREVMIGDAVHVRETRAAPLRFARCPACAELATRAAALVAAQEVGARVQLGAGSAQHRVESVLCALAVLGVARSPDPATATGSELVRLVRHLAADGAATRWLARFAPIVRADARPDTAAACPWAHVEADVRAALRSCYAAALRERLSESAPPMALPPPALTAADLGTSAIPAEAGCLMCGLSAVQLPAAVVARAGGPAAAARAVWTLKRVPAVSLGGRSSAVVVGHFCPDCSRAAERVGAIGPSALTRALVDHIAPDAVSRLGPDLYRLALDGLRGWGALAAEADRRGEPPPEPGHTGWAHVADPAELADRVRSALGVG